jgi:demethylmenaquinone methyltransferase/2-methoxy-6-polyprenyl-1,4-benzoquinol methylase
MPSARPPGPASAQAPLADPNRFAQDLFTNLPKHYDRLEAILSLGQNERWRREMVDHVVSARPMRVLDVATGTAGVALQLADRTPAHIVGVDLTEAMLRRGRENVARARAGSRIQLVGGRAEKLPFPGGAFDALTFTYLLRYVDDPAATLVELARVLKPGAPIASLEFHVPTSRFWRAWWWLYTRLVLPAGGALVGGRAWFRVGRFLGPNISGHYRRHPLAATVAMWRDAGIVDVEFRLMSLGGGLVMWGRKGG